MGTCIYCGAKDNLVAQLTLTIDDGSKVSVDVCADHADDATIRTAKQKYMERMGEINDLLQRAKALGLELAPQPTASGLLLVQSTGKNSAAVNEAANEVMRGRRPVQELVDDPEMLDADIVERRERRAMVSRGGQAGAHTVESHQSIDMTDVQEQLGSDVLRGKVKMEIVEKQSGAAVAIPTKKINGLGTTTIRVVQTTDQEMQRRFKTIAEQSKSPMGWDMMRHLGKEGVEIVNCPICRGDGVTRNAGKEVVCPKCKGKGMLN